MHTKSLSKVAGVLALTGAAILTGVGSASAGQPGWSMAVTNLSPVMGSGATVDYTVAAGAGAGYQVTITNNGPSNIPKLYLATTTDTPAGYVDDPSGACSGTGQVLTCSFGALGQGRSVTVVAGFKTPTDGSTSFDPGFYATTSGSTGSDKGSMSHGDQLTDPNEAATHLVDDPTFAGGFSLAGETISTAPVSDSHHQSTSVTPPGGGYVVTAQDGLSDGAFSCTDCSTRFGEWSSVAVDHGSVSGPDIFIPAQQQAPVRFIARAS